MLSIFSYFLVELKYYTSWNYFLYLFKYIVSLLLYLSFYIYHDFTIHIIVYTVMHIEGS